MLGLFHGTRHDVVAALWQYVKSHSLQDSEEPEWINCDDYMLRVFPDTPRIRFTALPTLLDTVLLPLSPLTLKYTIPMEYGQHKREVYELDVEVEDPNRDAMAPLFDDIEPEVRSKILLSNQQSARGH